MTGCPIVNFDSRSPFAVRLLVKTIESSFVPFMWRIPHHRTHSVSFGVRISQNPVLDDDEAFRNRLPLIRKLLDEWRI